MIQARRDIFETNSSSTHCLTIMPRQMYDEWHNNQIAVSIQYVYSTEDKDKNFCNDPTIRLPLNFKSVGEAKNLSKEKYGDDGHYDQFTKLRYGDDGFMNPTGNFDTYAPIVRTVKSDEQREANVKLLNDYTKTAKWHMGYLKEAGRYDDFNALVDNYAETGEFTEEMYSMFPSYLYYTPGEYVEMLRHDDCYSTFIHKFGEYVAFGYYFHS